MVVINIERFTVYICTYLKFVTLMYTRSRDLGLMYVLDAQQEKALAGVSCATLAANQVQWLAIWPVLVLGKRRRSPRE